MSNITPKTTSDMARKWFPSYSAMLYVKYLDVYDHQESRYAALAERAFVRELDGGCTSPVAAHARIAEGQIRLRVLYYRESTKDWYVDEGTGPAGEAEELGKRMAMDMRERYGL